MASSSSGGLTTAIVGIVGLVVGAGAVYFLAPQAQTGGGMSSPVAASSAPAKTGDVVVAKVNGSPIYKSEVDSFIANLTDQVKQMPETELRPRVVDRLIDIKLADAKAIEEKVNQDPALQDKIRTNDAQLLADAYLEKQAKASVTDDVLKAKYDELAKQATPTQEVHARHILLKSEADAKDVIKQLDKGADFEKLAKDKSTDPGSGESGGDLGYFTKDKMVPEFADAAFAMNKGDYSKVPVHSQFGWHVIQVLDKRDQPLPGFDQVKPQLTNLVMQDQIGKVLAGLHNGGAKIEHFNPDGTLAIPQPAVAETPAAPATAPAAPPAPAPAAAPAAVPVPAPAAAPGK